MSCPLICELDRTVRVESGIIDEVIGIDLYPLHQTPDTTTVITIA